MPSPQPHITCNLDHLLARNNLTLTELSKRVNISYANLSTLKNGRARAIRFTTLLAICQELNCQVGDLLHITYPNPTNKP